MVFLFTTEQDERRRNKTAEPVAGVPAAPSLSSTEQEDTPYRSCFAFDDFLVAFYELGHF